MDFPRSEMTWEKISSENGSSKEQAPSDKFKEQLKINGTVTNNEQISTNNTHTKTNITNGKSDSKSPEPKTKTVYRGENKKTWSI